MISSKVLLTLFVVGVTSSIVAGDQQQVKIELHRDPNKAALSAIPIPLDNFYHTVWFGHVNFGTPKQEFTVIFDSGADLIWIPSKQCRSFPCKVHKQYDCSRSTTYHHLGTPFVLDHRGFNISGILDTDDLSFGEGAILKQQVFGEATQISAMKMALSKYDGVFGLGLGRKLNVTSPFENMIKQKLVSEQVFSVYLNRHTDAAQGSGELLFGGINKDRYEGDFNRVKTIDGGWNIKIDEISLRNISVPIDGSSVCKGKDCKAIVWSGAPLMVGPRDPVAKLNSMLNAKEISNGAWLLPSCDTSGLPDMVIKLQGKDMVLKPEQYVVKAKFFKFEQCFSGLAGKDGYRPEWILGDVFISAYYTVFDYGKKEIAFAKAVVGEKRQ